MPFNNSNSRRKFLVNSGKGILGGSLITPSFFNHSLFAAASSVNNTNDTIPIKLTSTAAPSEKQSTPPPALLDPAKRKGYAIVGLGHLALEQIMPAFGSSRFSKPVALVSGDAEKAQQVAQQYGIKSSAIYNYENFDDIKNNPEIDIVYLVLPNGMHKEFTIRAAKAGAHVLCEKPMATSSEDANAMIKACKDAGKKLMIAYRIQYEPNNHFIKEWVRNNKYGKVKIIESFNGQNMGDPKQWRLNKKLSVGGPLPDVGIYCINTIRYQLGEEPVWVSAYQQNSPDDERFKEVEEAVLFQMGFASGTIAYCGTSYGVHDCKRYRCFADSGAWFGMDPAFPYQGLKIEMSEAKENFEWSSITAVAKNQFALEMDHMSECVMYNRKPFTPGEEGLQDHIIMEAIYQSAKEKRMIELKNDSNKKDQFRGTVPSYD